MKVYDTPSTPEPDARAFPEIVSKALSAFFVEHGRYPNEAEINAWRDSVFGISDKQRARIAP